MHIMQTKISFVHQKRIWNRNKIRVKPGTFWFPFRTCKLHVLFTFSVSVCFVSCFPFLVKCKLENRTGRSTYMRLFNLSLPEDSFWFPDWSGMGQITTKTHSLSGQNISFLFWQKSRKKEFVQKWPSGRLIPDKMNNSNQQWWINFNWWDFTKKELVALVTCTTRRGRLSAPGCLTLKILPTSGVGRKPSDPQIVKISRVRPPGAKLSEAIWSAVHGMVLPNGIPTRHPSRGMSHPHLGRHSRG